MSKRKEYYKICERCNNPYTAKSKTAKYCSDSCRVMAYKIRNNIPMPDFLFKKIAEKIPTKTEIEIAEKTHELDNVLKRIEVIKKEEEHYISLMTKKYKDTLDTAISMESKKFIPPVDYNYKKDYSINSLLIEFYKDINFYTKEPKYNTFTLLKHTYLKDNIEETLEQARIYVITNLQNKIQQAMDDYKKINNLEDLREKAVLLEEEISRLYSGYNVNKLVNKGILVDSDDILAKEYNILELSDNFQNVLGHPEKNFVAMIHGEAGSGKSSFAVKFASYFNKNFGKSCYVSMEEGTSYTFQKKIKSYATYGNFSVIELHDSKEISDILKNYDLVVIDSISHGRYTQNDINLICQTAISSNTALLFVVHNTKENKYQGHASLNHLVHIRLLAENGLITPHKNRYELDDLDDYTYRIYIPKMKK